MASYRPVGHGHRPRHPGPGRSSGPSVRRWPRIRARALVAVAAAGAASLRFAADPAGAAAAPGGTASGPATASTTLATPQHGMYALGAVTLVLALVLAWTTVRSGRTRRNEADRAVLFEQFPGIVPSAFRAGGGGADPSRPEAKVATPTFGQAPVFTGPAPRGAGGNPPAPLGGLPPLQALPRARTGMVAPMAAVPGTVTSTPRVSTDRRARPDGSPLDGPAPSAAFPGSGIPPGWHVVDGPGDVRAYWDGNNWTGRVRWDGTAWVPTS